MLECKSLTKRVKAR